MYEGQISETIRYPGHGGDAIEAYYARPLGAGPFPSVVVIHHMPGWDLGTKEITRRFAHEGYAAVAPHLFHREGGDGVSIEDAAARARANGGVPDERFLGDAEGAIDFLRSQAYTTNKVGMIGYCSGGRQTYISAAKLPIDAAVDCYGGRVVVAEDQLTAAHPVAPLAMTPEIHCPILCMFGVEDANPSQEDRSVIAAALSEHHKAFEIVNFEDAGHGFFGTHRPSYRVAVATAGWEKLLEFFGDHLSETNAS